MAHKVVYNASSGVATAVALTPEEAAEQAAREATGVVVAQQEATQVADDTTTRQLLLTAAQSAVGVAFTALDTNQLRALLAVVIHMVGGLAPDGRVKPLTQWVRKL